MTMPNGTLPAEDNRTIFTTVMSPFPYVDESKINTENFLDAAKGVVQLVDKLGKVFAPVRYDMNGNIDKLTTKYLEDHSKYRYLEDMILSERSEGGIIATDALMWLRRGLHFMQRFFEYLLAEGEEKTSLSNIMKVAYTDTLEPFHGWMGSQLFNIMCRFSPTRTEFFYMLALERHHRTEQVFRDMDHFVTNLTKCVQQLTEFYAENNLERHGGV